MTSFIVMDVLERAQELEREGTRIIHLEVGEPDFDTPTALKKRPARPLKTGLPITPIAWVYLNCGKRSANITANTIRYL